MTPTELVLTVTTGWAAIATLGGLLLGAVISHADRPSTRRTRG